MTAVRSGPSPRGRGNQLDIFADVPGCPRGSIPAWAGKPIVVVRAMEDHGSIPAWAGKPPVGPDRPCSSGTSGPSPRGRGNLPHPSAPRVEGGPSPRGRGNRSDMWTSKPTGSIPAWAGKPPCVIATARSGQGPSPRGRGNRVGVIRRAKACAGEVHPRVGGETSGHRPRDVSARPAGVHPRVGGETVPDLASGKPSIGMGPSPRGRGNRRVPAVIG